MAKVLLTKVLVTGGSGFVASYLILLLLAQGYDVRTTVRNSQRQSTIVDSLTNGGATADDISRLSFVEASLDEDMGWDAAVQDCRYVHHVASPNPDGVPKDEDDIIVPAREGTLRVLRAAAAAGVERVILTSSSSSIVYVAPYNEGPFQEDSWTSLKGDVEITPYTKSKTIAEKAAWDFVRSNENPERMELTTICPFYIIGPILGKQVPTSVLIIKKLMDGSLPGCPNLNFSFVDVRDVANLHILAMTNREASDERFLAAPSKEDKIFSMLEVGQIIKRNRPEDAKKVPNYGLPNFLVRLMSIVDKPVRLILPDLGKTRYGSNEKAFQKLGWHVRTTEESVIDTVDSLVRQGVV